MTRDEDAGGQRALEMARRVSLRHLLFSTGAMGWELDGRGTLRLWFEARVPDRNDASIPPRKTTIYSASRLEAFRVLACPDPEAYLLHFARRFLLDCMKHEVDEMLQLDGVQVHDPHEKEAGA